MSKTESLTERWTKARRKPAEPAVTDGLAFILTKHPQAMDAFNALLDQATQASVPAVTNIQAEPAIKGGKPDLAGWDAKQQHVLTAEIKINAPLSQSQRDQYLYSLPTNHPTAFVLVAPHQRLESDLLNAFHYPLNLLPGKRAGEGIYTALLQDSRNHLVAIAWQKLNEWFSAETAQQNADLAADLKTLNDTFKGLYKPQRHLPWLYEYAALDRSINRNGHKPATNQRGNRQTRQSKAEQLKSQLKLL